MNNTIMKRLSTRNTVPISVSWQRCLSGFDDRVKCDDKIAALPGLEVRRMIPIVVSVSIEYSLLARILVRIA